MWELLAMQKDSNFKFRLSKYLIKGNKYSKFQVVVKRLVLISNDVLKTFCSYNIYHSF